MTQNVYVVRDIVSTQILALGFAPTDGAFMRDTMSAILRMRPISELEFYQVGTFDDVDGSIIPVDRRKCSNDSYKFPETNSKKLTREDILALASSLQNESTSKE